MAIYDEKNFESTGFLLESEYKKFARILQSEFENFRIQPIRKHLAFIPSDYDRYLDEAKLNYDRKYAPIADPDLDPNLNFIPLVFTARFRAEFFPDLVREYDLTGGDPNVQVLEYDDLGYVQLPTESFRSIILANFEIEKEVRRRYRASQLYKSLSTHIEVDTAFITKPRIEFSSLDEMLVRLEVDVIM